MWPPFPSSHVLLMSGRGENTLPPVLLNKGHGASAKDTNPGALQPAESFLVQTGSFIHSCLKSGFTLVHTNFSNPRVFTLTGLQRAANISLLVLDLLPWGCGQPRPQAARLTALQHLWQQARSFLSQRNA